MRNSSYYMYKTLSQKALLNLQLTEKLDMSIAPFVN